MRDDRLTGLDLLRAIACLLVFMHHTTQRLDPHALSGGWLGFYRFFDMGAFGVGIFFMLSGFLLARPFWLAYDAQRPMPSLRVYAVRRAARIMPGYYVALLVSFLVAIVWFGTPLAPEAFIRLGAGLMFVGEFHWLTLFPVEVNGPLWSIGMEVASYALLPLGMGLLFASRPWFAGGRGRIVFAGVVALALAGQVLIVHLVPKETVDADFGHGMVGGAKYWMPQYNPVGFFAVFALGGLTAGLSSLWRGERHIVADALVMAGLGLAAGTMSWAGTAGLPEAFGWFGIPYKFPYFHLGIAIALFAFPHAKVLPAVSEAIPVRYLAKISFGIYLWHFLMLELVRQNFAPAFGYAGVNDTTYWLELTAISLVLALIAGTISWYAVEAPALAWVKRRRWGETRPVFTAQNMHA